MLIFVLCVVRCVCVLLVYSMLHYYSIISSCICIHRSLVHTCNNTQPRLQTWNLACGVVLVNDLGCSAAWRPTMLDHVDARGPIERCPVCRTRVYGHPRCRRRRHGVGGYTAPPAGVGYNRRRNIGYAVDRPRHAKANRTVDWVCRTVGRSVGWTRPRRKRNRSAGAVAEGNCEREREREREVKQKETK